MTQAITLPIRTASSFYRHDGADILDEICVPLEEAAEGDVVGVLAPFVRTGPTSDSMPILQLLTKAGGEEVFRATVFEHLPQDEQNRIGAHLMRFHNNRISSIHMHWLGDHLRDVESDNVQHFNLFLFTDFLFAMPDDFETAVTGRLFKQSFSQQMIDDAIMAIITKPAESAHEMIVLADLVRRITEIANIEFRFPTDQSLTRHAIYQAPPLSQIARL